MQVKPGDLGSHLAAGLQPAYLVAGDETLIVEETCDALLAMAREHGFVERSVMYVEPGFKWVDLLQDAASLSLFGERKVLDLRVPSNKFDKQGSEVLREYLAAPSPDNLLMVRTGRLDSNQRKSAWFKAFDAAGVVVLVWPIGQRELPRWLGARVQKAGLQLSADALEFLCSRVEGNLLAAMQEVEKLQLADLPQPIDVDEVMASIEDSSHFDAFELVDAVFAGDGPRVRHVLATLREEGVALFALLGALTSQLRMVQSGRRLIPQRQRLVGGFLKRVGSVEAVLAQCALVDQQGKGALLGDAWISFENLLLRMAGVRLTSLEAQLPHLRPGR